MPTITQTQILVSTSIGTFHFHLTEIIRCQASSNYTWFYLTGDRKLLVARTLGRYEGLLAQANFLRIHQGDIINRAYIAGIDNSGTVQLSDGTCLSISRRRRSSVRKMLAAAQTMKTP